MVPSALPYLLQKRAMPEFDRSFAETVRLSADLIDYLRVNTDNILAQSQPAGRSLVVGFLPRARRNRAGRGGGSCAVPR